ncbi:MAG: FtsQ-type POTRA domain-containing protein [Propionibacterium sp.]|nr:FtsQ-type POTRA domain-containing protein [Propionibacterium sp.]
MPSPKEFAEALRAERAGKRRRTWWLAGGAATAAVIVGVLVWLFFFSSTFLTSETAVEGARIVTVEEYVATAAVPTGEPLARVDVRAVEERVRSLSEVAAVEVSRDFPGTVRIVVTERLAVYQLQDLDTYSWVDEHGVIFRTGEALVESMPVVDVDEAEERLLADVATVVEHLPAPIASSVERIEAGSVDLIELVLDDDRRVVWGSAEESALKAEVLDTLLQVEADVYDVSAPNHPTTR